MKKILKRIVASVICAVTVLTSGVGIAYASNIDATYSKNKLDSFFDSLEEKPLASVSFSHDTINEDYLARVREITMDIVGDETDVVKQLGLIKNWFLKYNPYSSEEIKDVIGSEFSQYTGRWVCSEKSDLFTEMCRVIGVETIRVDGGAWDGDISKNPNFASDITSHQWNLVYVNNEWYVCDPSWFIMGDNYFLADIDDAWKYRLYSNVDYGNNAMKDYTCSDYAIDGIKEAYMNYLFPRCLSYDLRHSYSFTTEVTRKSFAYYAIQLYSQVTGISRADLEEKYESQFVDFSDANGDTDIGIASALGIVSGVGDNKFNPNANITRQEAATLLMRLGKVLGLEMTGSAAQFNDVDDNSWAKEGIDYVSSLGIMTGVGNGNFDPNGLYTHEQTALTMVRLFNMVK